MLTKGDDYPLHQSPEPIAFAGNRNFYDRYFFNGYSADGSLFFAAAMGIYPQLDIIDASFCVLVDGTQHNLRASRRMEGERLDLAVGPIRIDVVEPLERLRIRVDGGDDAPIKADLSFAARHTPIEEPRFTRRQGTRVFMDYTRLTQNGAWNGTIDCDGQSFAVSSSEHLGTRDRSWGVRPVGAPDSQPPPMGALPQFFWLWAPLNFPDHASFFHTNDDGEGACWNRRAVVDALGGRRREFGDPVYKAQYRPGTRRIEEMTAWLCAEEDIEIIVRPSGPEFLMSGLGYTHPEWGHGMDHGEELAVAYDTIDTAKADPNERLNLHIQAFSEAVLKIGQNEYRGHGVLEQLLLGPHAPSGFASLLDPAE